MKKRQIKEVIFDNITGELLEDNVIFEEKIK